MYVAIIVWSFMLQRDNGVVNTLLVHELHLAHNPPFWLLGSKAFWSMVAAAVWRWFPFAFLILLAALQNIPTEMYEAAAVDGAVKLAPVPLDHAPSRCARPTWC